MISLLAGRIAQLCRGRRLVLLSRRTVPSAAFNRRSFFVVVPSYHQQEWQRVGVSVKLPPQAQRLFKGLAAARVHEAVFAPGSFAVVEAGPRGADRELVRVLLLHFLVE